MFKRIIPLVAILSLLVAMFVVPASAVTVNGRTVIDYNDYVSNVKVDGENDVVTIFFSVYMYGVQKIDSTGRSYKQGVDLGNIMLSDGDKNALAGVYFPGAGVTNSFLDLSNIPDGSVFTTTGKVWLELNTLGSGVLEGYYYLCIQYFDSNFQVVSNQRTNDYDIFLSNGAYVYDLTYKVAIKKPENAMYCATFFMYVNQNVIKADSSDVVIWFDFDIPKLQMSINFLYRLQEQSGKTNKLLDQIVNGEVTFEAPEGSGSVGDLDDIEGALKDDTSAGRDEAEQVFNESWGLVVAHTAGFLFLSNVIERMIGVGWLRGILTVSLSLGIFAFIVNIATTIGNKLSSKGGKSGKGGKP